VDASRHDPAPAHIEWLCRFGHRLRIGHWPDLDSPRTFNEKIQAFKLRQRPRELVDWVDKAAVKPLVADMLGPDWIIPSLFEGPALPQHRTWSLPYVIKANNSSGRNLFVRTQEEEDWNRLSRRAARWMRRPHPAITGEWLYTRIKPKIIAEPLLGGDRLPPDFKFFVFDGRVEMIQVDTNRDRRHTRKLFDRDWNEMPVTLHYPRDPEDFPRPGTLETMIAAAEKLGAVQPFVRADFYEIEGVPKFGEVTFTPGAGVEEFDPPHQDARLGALWPWDERPVA